MPTNNENLYEFMLGSPPQNAADDDVPWFIDAITGETRTRAQVKILADSLARGLRTHFRFQRDYSDIATTQTFDLQSSSSPSQNRTKGSKYNIGSVVSIVSPNNVDFGACVWACHKIGCTVAPSNAGSTVDELTHQFRLTGAQVIITHPNAFSSVLRAARAVGIPDGRIVVLGNREVISLEGRDDLAGFLTIQDLVDINITAGDPSDNISAECQIAFLCFSSGTTGLPKAVVIPHEAVIANVNQVASTAIPGSRASPGDKALGVIPLSHMYGLLTLLHLCPHLGISSVLYPGMPPFEPFLDSLENLRVNHLFLAPPLVNAFLKHPAAQGRDLGFFKTCLVAAAPLDADREDAFRNLCGPNLLLSQAFGMTETAGLVTSLFPGAQPISGTVGRLVPSTEAKILDSEGRPVSAGERGELFVRGPQLCLGYLNNENENRLAFDDQGFLRTGDEVVMLPSGDIRVMDRLKNIIKHKGFQVSPAELEGHILLHPFVEDVGVVGRPDERAGETPVAFVVLSSSGKDAAQFDEDHVKDTIQDHVRRAKSQYKWLGDVFFVNAIPRLPSGKILLRELRAMLALPQSRPSVVTLQNKSFSPSISSLSASAGERTLKETPSMPQQHDVEKGVPVSSRDVLPTPPTSTATIRARDRRAEPAPTTFQRAREWISLYRIFFTVILTVNTVGAGFTLARKWTDGEEYAATFALCNIMAGLLARNEVFLRALYTVLLFLFKRWPPYIFRSAIANFLLHFGGLHSGFAASGTLWLIVATIQFFRQGPTEINPVILAFCILASVLLLTVCASAYPALRNSHHNVFENTHRLVGWFGLAVLWVLVCIADSWDASLQRFVGTMLISRPDIYLAIALTVCIALPWTTLRKVEVKAQVLSSSVVHLRFKAGYRPGLFGRVSRHPLRENHAFGIASTSPSSGEHSMYIVGQGDFTRGLIADPPTYLWTRSFKFVGLPYMASFYRSGVYVVTGSAIGVALSVFLQLDPGSKWHLLWICGNVHETYGSTAIKDLKASFDDETTYNETVTIWDTRKQGRPDLIELVSAQVEHQQAEVVFVTSNPKGTADTIRACAKRGIPCLGPVWDS